MNKTSILGICIIALVALAAWAPNSEAYSTFGGGCQTCHGDFLAAGYVSNASQDPEPWNTSLHSGHQGFAPTCGACHQQTGDNPLIGGPSNDGFDSCMGCHGRDEDITPDDGAFGGPGPGRGDGLRAHHGNICIGCHSGDTTPVGENVPGARNAALGVDPCSDAVFGIFGSDNDGDNLYDGDDPDCAAPECTIDADCDDGTFCNGAETCDANGTCQPGTPPICDDGVACTVDSCDQTTDACVYTPDDLSCNDNELCTTDSCDALTGCANVPVGCPAGEQCDSADGVCKPEPECTVDADCDNGFFCDGTETCDTATGTCQAGMGVNCDDGVGCTVDTCDEGNDACVNTPDNTSCDDGNVCNGLETCDPVNDCQPGTPLVCDDGELCTTDSCDPISGCAFVPVECPDGQQCDSMDGICKDTTICTDDQFCDDGMFCNGAESCDTATGTCQPGTPPDCDDGIDCTVDTCDEVNDVCFSTPDDTICDDGDLCNGIETCDPNNDCQAGTPPDCNDGNLCTTDGCEPIAGCTNLPVDCPAGEQCDQADGTCQPEPACLIDEDCDDGMFCNGAETCDATGTCQPGMAVDCDDGIDCTVDTCDESLDTCVSTPDDSACPDDGMFCTGQEICDPAGGCISTGDPCPEGMTCNEETDTCDMVGGKVTICHIPPGNPSKARTKSINAESVDDHLAHGDLLGPCPQ